MKHSTNERAVKYELDQWEQSLDVSLPDESRERKLPDATVQSAIDELSALGDLPAVPILYTEQSFIIRSKLSIVSCDVWS